MNIGGVLVFSRVFTNSAIRWIVGSFTIEELAYVVVGSRWISEHRLSQLYAHDVFAGVFFSTYGPNDFLFMVFFVWVFWVKRPRA